jgi:two-component system, OmpR family, phosphate regulon sensor histidine kinase PhoR
MPGQQPLARAAKLAVPAAQSYKSRMMSTAKTQPNHLLSQLWFSLITELEQVFDPHFVCAIIATEIARFSGIKTVIGFRNPQHDYYDVWICAADGTLIQKRWPVEKTPFTAIWNSEKAVHLSKLSQPVTDLMNSELWLIADENLLAVPLPLTRKDLEPNYACVLCLLDPVEDSPIDAADLENFSLGLTVYLDRAALRRQVDKQEVEFAVVSDISHSLTSTLSMERLFQELTGTIRRILQVESLSVGLSDANTGEVVFVSSLMGARFDNLPVIRVKPGQGIAGWVAERGEAVIVNDVYGDRRFYSAPDSKSGFRTRSMICIPLQVEEQTIGVLQAINRRYGKFTDHDLSLLQAIGGPLAAAIENSRLHTDVITEKRRVETILTGMSDGLLAVSQAGIITRTNDALLLLLLADEDRVLGMPVDEVIKTTDASLSSLIELSLAQSEDVVQLATDLRRANGETLPVLISGAPIRKESGQIDELILTFSDLSQIREVERMRDDLFHAIAHELRTPLATILMYARLLLEGKAQDEEKAARFLGVIERESDRLQYMVRRMMQLAKQEARELRRSSEPIRLNPLLDDIVPPLAEMAHQKGLYFRKEIETDLPSILSDEERFEEIIQNLIGNAIKFTPSGTIRLTVRREDNNILIKVADEGIGIPKQALPNLFNRFFRAQSAVDRGIAGTGLGLYMVKQNVEQYNGSITVESQLDAGTTFELTFPVYEE